jgi:hypothetical protein
MTQLGLDFTPPRARRSDPDTSCTAAKRAASSQGALLRAVLGALLERDDGLTAIELAILIGARDGSISPRMVELERVGLVRRTGAKRRSAGRGLSEVWMAC